MAKTYFEMGKGATRIEYSIRAHETRMPKHMDLELWVNNLVMDLKLQLIGEQPVQPVTLERLQEWARLRDELARCTEDISLKF